MTCLIRQIPKHNVIIVGGDLNTYLGKDIGYKYAYNQTTNRNCQMFKENNILYLKFRL